MDNIYLTINNHITNRNGRHIPYENEIKYEGSKFLNINEPKLK